MSPNCSVAVNDPFIRPLNCDMRAVVACACACLISLYTGTGPDVEHFPITVYNLSVKFAHVKQEV